MATPLPVLPSEQAKLLRKIADDIESRNEPVPAEVLAPFADLASRRLQQARERAREALDALEADAVAKGWDELTEDEIMAIANEEIAMSRAERRASGQQR